MVSLIAQTPAQGLLPVTIGSMTLRECDPQALTSLSRTKQLRAALKEAHGLGLPAPGRSTGTAEARCLWLGHAHVLLVGPPPDPALAKVCAVTDQSDAWTRVRLEGDRSADVLARLTPIDLRASVFKTGHTARTDLQHMNASITRTRAQAFEIMVMRSMARTLIKDLTGAMRIVAA